MKQTQVKFEEIRDLNHDVYIMLKNIIDQLENIQANASNSRPKWPNENHEIARPNLACLCMHVFWGFFLIKLGDRVLVRNIRRFHKSQDNVRYLGLARKASDISDYKQL